jgi:hypothetical protein
MPYMVSGSTVYKKNGKKRTVKAKAKSKASAKRMVRLLYMIEGGKLPTRRRGRRRGRKT